MDRYSDDDQDDDDEHHHMHPTMTGTPPRSPQFETEREFYARFAKFLALLVIFFLVMFFSEWEHENVLFFGGLACFGLWMAYMVGSMLYTIFVLNPRHALANILTEEELGDMDQSMSNNEEDLEANAGEGVGRMAIFSFEETPPMVRACREDIRYLPGKAKPTSGVYHIVYNAVFFGKSIRSESKLHLQFEANKNSSGWEVQGTIVSGSVSQGNYSQRPISDGFVNGRGEMYWQYMNNHDETKMDGIYRGILNFRDNTMYDGEFKAGQAPPGRIVRMELIQEGGALALPKSPPPSNGQQKQHRHIQDQEDNDGWGSTDMDVEMVEFDKPIV